MRRHALLLPVLVVQVLAPQTGGGQRPGSAALAVGALAAVAQVAVLLRRRTAPLPTAATVVALYAVQVAATDVVVPAAGWVAVWVVAASVADRVRALRATAAVTATLVGVLFAGEALHDGSGAAVLLAGVSVAVGLAALLRRSERGRLDAVRAEATSAERLRLARDLHDLAGHGLGVVAVQSSTARMALDAGDTAAARTALAAVESSSRGALREMRQLLGVLRDASDDGAAPAPGLADLTALVDGVRAAGVEVAAEVVAADVPVPAQLCAYRVVQESLTNAVKHGRGPVDVEVRRTGGSLHVSVRSHGSGTAGGGTGTGLDGIRARVAAAGGTTRIGPLDGGWSVEAELPLEVP